VQYEHFLYPSYDTPLVEAYDRRFESVFVILHPFVSVPDHLAWKATRRYPSDEQIRSLGAKCPWSRVASQTGLSTCAKLNQALLTSRRSIADELCDFSAAKTLEKFLQSEPIWMPGEGRFEPLLQTDFLHVFTSAGYDDLVFVPEFPNVDPVQRLSISGLKTRRLPFPSRGTLASPDEHFLLTVDWESFFTLFYGPQAFVSEVVRQQNLEGFFATPTTEHSWFNYTLGCCVITMAPDGWPAI